MYEINILINHQFGFRQSISTENAVDNLVNQVYQAFDKGEFKISIFLDLTKGFDIASRTYLLRKLFLYGTSDIENYGIINHSTASIQVKNIGDYCSSVLPLEKSVLQGRISA